MARIDYYVSLNSPWAYLGSQRIEEIARRYNAALRIWPVDFSIIFAATGGLPLPRRSPQRQAYRMQELARWRDHLGMALTLRPAASPFAEPLAAHAVIALREAGDDAGAIRLAHRIMRAVWAEERDPGLPSTLATLITECGLEAGPLLALAADPRWAAMRQANSEAALARGVFGAPSYVIDEQIFWGQDRLEFVDRALAQMA